jgi:hypothetical protein
LDKPLAIHPAVLQRLRALPKTERVECLLALCELPTVFGKPHLHSGLTIRKLNQILFECRGNISLRFIFENRASDLFVSFLANHDEIIALLRSRKYH